MERGKPREGVPIRVALLPLATSRALAFSPRTPPALSRWAGRERGRIVPQGLPSRSRAKEATPGLDGRSWGRPRPDSPSPPPTALHAHFPVGAPLLRMALPGTASPHLESSWTPPSLPLSVTESCCFCYRKDPRIYLCPASSHVPPSLNLPSCQRHLKTLMTPAQSPSGTPITFRTEAKPPVWL